MLLVDQGVAFDMVGVNYGAEAAGENKVIGGNGCKCFRLPCSQERKHGVESKFGNHELSSGQTWLVVGTCNP